MASEKVKPAEKDKKKVASGEETKDPLSETVSLQEIRQKLLKQVEEKKYQDMVKMEEELDLPYYLHGVQNRPDFKVGKLKP